MIKCCKGCEKREVGCHGKCDIYLKEKNEAAEESKAKLEYLIRTEYREDVIKRRKLRDLKIYGDYLGKRKAGLTRKG
jgi:hypothetical protein